MPRGRLITIEGIDGAGKSTLAGALAEALRARGIDVVALREPGGVGVAERIRALVKDPALEIAPRTEALLYAASRAQLVAQAVEPALAAGRWVLLDRYVDSSLAYQGAGRGLGVEAVAAVNAFGTGGLAADRTLLLAIDPAAGRARRGGRDAHPTGSSARPTPSSTRSPRPTRSSPRPSRRACACWTRPARPSGCWRDALDALADLW